MRNRDMILESAVCFCYNEIGNQREVSGMLPERMKDELIHGLRIWI